MNWLIALILTLALYCLDAPRWAVYTAAIGTALGLYALGVR